MNDMIPAFLSVGLVMFSRYLNTAQAGMAILNFADTKDINGGALFDFESRAWLVLTGNRSARSSLLLVSGPTRRHISIAAHQLEWCS
jgi:hypothetical protein